MSYFPKAHSILCDTSPFYRRVNMLAILLAKAQRAVNSSSPCTQPKLQQSHPVHCADMLPESGKESSSFSGRNTCCSRCYPFYFDSIPIPICTRLGPAMALQPAVQSLSLRSELQHGACKWILVCLPLIRVFSAWGSWILAFFQIPDNPVMQRVSGQNWE